MPGFSFLGIHRLILRNLDTINACIFVLGYVSVVSPYNVAHLEQSILQS